MAKKLAAKKTAKRKKAANRNLVDTCDQQCVRRGAGGEFKESDGMGRSLTADRRKKPKTTGQGDKGDR